MPVINPFDPLYNFPDISPDDLGNFGSAGGSGGGSTQPPPATGGSTNPTGGTSGASPWPAWATAIDSNVQGWRTLDGGHLLHKATNRVYSPTGTFVATLSDYLAGVRDEAGMNPEGPPQNGHPGDTWTNPDTEEVWQYYANLGWMNTTADPKNPNELGPVDEGGLGPEGTLPPGSPDPGDGPVGGQLPVQISPNWDPPSGNWIGLPPPTGSSTGGGTGMANPMPGMPTTGIRGVPPHLAVSQQQGKPVGQREAFKPWGEPLGYLSQALRYGGTPDLYLQGGSQGMDALASALRGEG